MIRLPRLLDRDLNEVSRIQPLSYSVTENSTPLSTANIQLQNGDSIPERSWVEIYTPNGSAGIFRARTPSNGYGDQSSSVELEHGITELGDYLVESEIEQDMALNSAISTLFGHYGGSHWQLGSNSFTDTVAVDVDYDNVLEAMLGVLDQTPYMLTFDFTTTPWTFNVAQVDQNVSAEGRLSRNVSSAQITKDDTDFATRVYASYKTTQNKEEVTVWIYEQDDTAIANYGIVEKKLDDDFADESKARSEAQKYLNKHKAPKISASISGYDFYAVTGEPLDQVRIGKKYRLAIEGESDPVEEVIKSITWQNPIDDEYSVTISLAEEDDFLMKTLNESKSTKKSSKKTKKELDSLHYEFYSDDGYFRSMLDMNEYRLRTIFEDGQNSLRGELEMTASHLKTVFEDGQNSLRGEFEITASHLKTEFTDGLNSLHGEFEVTASHMRADFTDDLNSLRGEFEVTASHLRTAFEDDVNSLRGEFEVTAQGLRTSFENGQASLRGEFEVTASHLRGEFIDGLNSMRGEFEVTATHLRTAFEDGINSLRGDFEVTAQGLRTAFEDGQASLRSEFEITASHMRIEFSNEMNSMRTYVEQTDSGWRTALEGVVDADGNVTSASIATAINAQGQAGVKITGKWVQIGSGSSSVSLNDVLTIEGTYGKFLKPMFVGSSSSDRTTINGGVVTANHFDVKNGGSIRIYTSDSQYWDLNKNTFNDWLTSAVVQSANEVRLNNGAGTYMSIEKSGNSLIFKDKDGNQMSFSKAVTLSEAWDNGDFPLTINATQTNSGSTTIVGSKSIGFTNASNIYLTIEKNGTPSAFGQSRKLINVPYKLVHHGGTGVGDQDRFTGSLASVDATSVYNNGWEDSYGEIELNYSSNQELGYGGSRTIYPVGKATPSAESASILSKGITVSAKTDANLVAGNIKSGVTIFGITGSYAPTHSPVASEFVAQSSDPGDGYTSRSVTPDANTKWYKYTVTCGGTTSNYKLYVDSTNRYNAGYDADHNTLGIYDEQDNLLNANHYYKTLQYGEEFKCWAGFKKTNNEFSWNLHVVSITAPPNNYYNGYDATHAMYVCYENSSHQDVLVTTSSPYTLDYEQTLNFYPRFTRLGTVPQGESQYRYGYNATIKGPNKPNLVICQANEGSYYVDGNTTYTNNSDGYWISGDTVAIAVDCRVYYNGTYITTLTQYLKAAPTAIYAAGKAAGGGTHSISIDNADGPYRNVNEMKEATGQGTLTQILTGKTISSGYYAFRTTCGTAKKWYYFHV